MRVSMRNNRPLLSLHLRAETSAFEARSIKLNGLDERYRYLFALNPNRQNRLGKAYVDQDHVGKFVGYGNS